MVQGTYCTKGKDTITDEGLLLLDDMEMWLEKQNLMWACHNSRKKDRMNEDGSFLPHQKGSIHQVGWCDLLPLKKLSVGQAPRLCNLPSKSTTRRANGTCSSSLAFYWHSKKVSGPPLCPERLTKRRTYRPRTVIYRHVRRQSSEK